MKKEKAKKNKVEETEAVTENVDEADGKKGFNAVESVKNGIQKTTNSKFITEFKKFISRGNVLDMAVGMIIGTAFTTIVTTLVNNVLMPAIGMLIGEIDFTELKLVLKPAVTDGTEILEPEVAIGYGAFISAVINFLLIALSVFILIKVISCFKRKKKEEPPAPPAPDPQIVLLTEIRDLLKNAPDSLNENVTDEEDTDKKEVSIHN